MSAKPAASMPAASMDELPYTPARLDELMEAADIDVLLATSKHNVRYLLGGYQFIFFSAMDAIGHSRYLPVFVYVRGEPGNTAYVANRMEAGEHANHPFWVPHFFPAAWGVQEATTAAIDHLKKCGVSPARIGVETSFLPLAASRLLSDAWHNCDLRDASGILERLRALKTDSELALLKQASERISDSMQATITASRAGSTKHEIIDRLRLEETERGLQFEYCLLTLGASHNRAASDQAWAQGEVLSIDSGGNLDGYIGDICRMGVLGEPDAELTDLLEEIETVQQAAFSKIRAGALGQDVIARGQEALKQQPSREHLDFFAHGMGLISHEAPFLMTNHPVTYEGIDAPRPLEAGMVLSVETTMPHPARGFLKLEDTLVVRDDGYEMFGASGRGWNRGGAGNPL